MAVSKDGLQYRFAIPGTSRAKARRSEILVAACLTGSDAKWAYLAVVWTCVCPSNFPIIASPSPTRSPPDANVWRRS